MPAIVRGVSWGGMAKPFCLSLRFMPVTVVSMVSTSAS